MEKLTSRTITVYLFPKLSEKGIRPDLAGPCVPWLEFQWRGSLPGMHHVYRGRWAGSIISLTRKLLGERNGLIGKGESISSIAR